PRGGGPLPLGAAGARGLRPEPRAGKLTWASATRSATRSRSAPPPMARPVALVTGTSGLIGGAVRRQLGAGAELRALKRLGVYGASKVWGEALARHYADAHRLSVLCVRIGHVTAEDRPRAPRDFSVWCSQRDIARMIEACLRAPATLRFDVFFAVSNNKWSYRDLDHARRVLGFEPLDAAETHRT